MRVTFDLFKHSLIKEIVIKVTKSLQAQGKYTYILKINNFQRPIFFSNEAFSFCDYIDEINPIKAHVPEIVIIHTKSPV